MPASFKWPEPRWLAAIADDTEREKARIRFFLALAALYCTENGRLDALALCVGKEKGAVRTQRHRARPGPPLVLGIENELGRDLVPRELFRPDIYPPEAD
jgi:hypothetical protein